jgi:hypothetical protein
MSDPQKDPADEIAAAGEDAATEAKAPAASGYRAVAIALAGALVLVVVLVGTAPFWAPLLPWGAAPAREDTALAARIDRLDAAQQQSAQHSQQQEAALQRLDRRVGALEARPAAPPAADIADIRQQLTKLSAAVAGLGDLTARVEALDKAAHAQAAQAGADTADTALVLALLQIRGAVAAGRPFAAEYEALVGLARVRPEIAAAAVPLAEPAKTGVASRAVLANRLRELAGPIATANAPKNAPGNATAPAAGWADAALTRLRGLVTVRRIDGGGRNSAQGGVGAGPKAAVNAAELALAGGDLGGAVAALDKLTGAPAEAARPWLRMAEARLAVEAALSRIEALLAARLGAPANAPGPSR